MNPRLATQVEWGGARGASLREMVGEAAVRFDMDGVRMAFGEAPADGTMCVAGARRSWVAERRDGASAWDAEVGLSGEALAEVRAEAGAEAVGLLGEALARACAEVPAGRVALALSGGVDSAVLAALLGGRAAVYTLESGLPGYCEAAEAQVVADRLGVELRRVRVDAEAFVRALPAAVRAGETPLYNLHPVGRYLLARAVRADGFDILVTGDGADEVFGGTGGGDYLPVVGALTRAAGLVAWAPFLTPAVAAVVREDPEKRALRALARELEVPALVAERAKRPRFAPAMDLRRYWDEVEISALGRALGRTPTREDDRDWVRWTTLALFAADYPGLWRCAG